MFNCKYVENTPDTQRLLTHRIQAFQSDSVRFKQRQSRAIGKSEVGSWKLEVGSRKSEVGRPFSAFVHTRRTLSCLSFACAHAGYLVIFTEKGK